MTNYLRKWLGIAVLFLTMASATAQLNMTQVGHLGFNYEMSDIWGWRDASGIEYALLGSQAGFSVVSLDDPTNPVEVFYEQGDTTLWRDVKTWNNHAYITNEASNGLLIVDLSTLPGNPNLSVTYYTGSSFPFTTAHNLYIDENGICYIFGSNFGNGGVIMLDLTDPKSPQEIGLFDLFYLHDGVVRGDTLWGSAIFDGFFAVIDVADKTVPILMQTKETPSNTSHNAWISDDGKYLYTTDEVSNGFIGSYDVTDMSNIEELDRFQSSPGQGVIPHNTHFLDEYLITSYYADGVHVLDVKRPHNMVEVGVYDTSPQFSGNGFVGCWGVYPYLPSGLIIAADIENGLFVLDVDYQRACYLEGEVTDQDFGFPLNNVTVEIISLADSSVTNITGDYATGILTPGTYDIRFSLPGYNTKVIPGVALSNGNVTVLNVKLDNWPVGQAELENGPSLAVFPNPSAEEIVVKWPQALATQGGQHQIQVRSLTGQLIGVLQFDPKQASELRLNPNWPAGNYYLEWWADDELLNSQQIVRQ